MRLAAVASSGIKWTEGKGVIGVCWATRQPQYDDLEKHFAPYANYIYVQWNALPAAIRFGLTFSDFQAVKGKYGIVAVVPIVSSADKYIGCVTADMPPLVGIAPVRDQVLKHLTLAAASVARVL